MLFHYWASMHISKFKECSQQRVSKYSKSYNFVYNVTVLEDIQYILETSGNDTGLCISHQKHHSDSKEECISQDTWGQRKEQLPKPRTAECQVRFHIATEKDRRQPRLNSNMAGLFLPQSLVSKLGKNNHHDVTHHENHRAVLKLTPLHPGRPNWTHLALHPLQCTVHYIGLHWTESMHHYLETSTLAEQIKPDYLAHREW